MATLCEFILLFSSCSTNVHMKETTASNVKRFTGGNNKINKFKALSTSGTPKTKRKKLQSWILINHWKSYRIQSDQRRISWSLICKKLNRITRFLWNSVYTSYRWKTTNDWIKRRFISQIVSKSFQNQICDWNLVKTPTSELIKE